MYQPAAWFHPVCNYHMPSSAFPNKSEYSSNGEICEHVLFHLCLSALSNDLKVQGGSVVIGVQPDLYVNRSPNIGGFNNPTLVYALFAALLLCCVYFGAKGAYRSSPTLPTGTYKIT